MHVLQPLKILQLHASKLPCGSSPFHFYISKQTSQRGKTTHFNSYSIVVLSCVCSCRLLPSRRASFSSNQVLLHITSSCTTCLFSFHLTPSAFNNSHCYSLHMRLGSLQTKRQRAGASLMKECMLVLEAFCMFKDEEMGCSALSACSHEQDNRFKPYKC